MKKLISLLLAVMMLASMASFAAAEEEKTLVFISQAAWKDQMQVLAIDTMRKPALRLYWRTTRSTT